jgi:UDP-N-acetylmuramate: L-alanyl-gamma-D-glutamyl-meso-diaminopimelate ligase
MKVHFIAIGGSAMHNLAIALKLKGYEVTGSDDEIFEPAHSRLKKYGILPEKEGWHPERVHEGLDAIILGMHAKKDNPELLKAEDLRLKIFSYPEFLYEQSNEKTRVVIAGSHGKTTITSMVLHVLQEAGIDSDYMVGAQLEGFEVMVRLSEKARFMVLEGDEYLSSPLDPRPKFHLYRPHIALLSGIAWDHMNVFPTFDNYLSQFEQFINLVEPVGCLVYCASDPEVEKLAVASRRDIKKLPYGNLAYKIVDQKAYLLVNDQEVPLNVFGKHNIQNIHGAWLVCKQIGVTDEQFLDVIRTFKGASKRLQLLKSNAETAVFKDFAHSPSKLKATINAVKELYPERVLVACIELHTYSSLNKEFLPLYRGCMDLADLPIVYYSYHALSLKRLPELSPQEVKEAFGDDRILVFNDSKEMQAYILNLKYQNKNLLLMSSGNFDGLNLEEIAALFL